jgi:hypothetical protein
MSGRSDSQKMRDHIRQAESREFIKTVSGYWHEAGNLAGKAACGAERIVSVARGRQLPEPACQNCLKQRGPTGRGRV